MEAAQATNRNKSLMYEDILLLVFCLLPPEASARFKSVCTYWNRLISSSSYIQFLHKCCADSKHVIGFYHGSKVPENLQFGELRREGNEQKDVQAVSSELVEEHTEDYGYGICATCDGFFLLDYITELILRNPLTKTNLRLRLPPQPPPREDSTRLIYYGLDVSSSSSSKQGVNNNLDIKIMNITIGRESRSSLCSVYTSSTGLWTRLKMDDMDFERLSSPQDHLLGRSALDPYPSLNPVGATVLRRSLHWLFDDGRIFAFDLEEQKWRHMETPATQQGTNGDVSLIKNFSDIIYATVKSTPYELRTELGAEFVNKLNCYLYPNIWFGSVGEHIYLVFVVDETNLQLWILDNYDKVEWRILVDLKNCGFVAPLFFDGRRIFVAAFDFEEWKNKKGVIRFFDIFSRKWLPNNFIITDGLDQIRFFFARTRRRSSLLQA